MSTVPAAHRARRGGGRHAGRDARRALAGAVAAVAVAVTVGLFVVATVLGFPIVGLLGAILVGAVVGAGTWWGYVVPRFEHAEDRVAALLGPCRAPGAGAEARLLNLVEGLAPTAGLPRPRCLIVEDPAANAAAFGRDPRHGAIVATTGLLERLSRMELEAVVAHCLVRVRDGDTAGPTVALAFRRRPTSPADAITEVDLAAVSLTRYPPGLSSALRSIAAARHGGAPDVPSSAAASMDPLWLAPPGDIGALETRAAALDEL